MKCFKPVEALKRYGWIIIIVAGLVPYLNSFRGEFVFDDLMLVEMDGFYDDAGALDNWKRTFWTEDLSQGLYRPLTTFSYWLNVQLAGKYSPAFRAFNIILNIVVCLTLYLLLKRLKFGETISLSASLIFAVHPLHAEAVIPAFGRAELLCALFIFSGLLFHTYSRERYFARFAVMACVVMSFWSKEHGIILMPLCIVYDCFQSYLDGQKINVRKILPTYSMYALGLLAVAWTRIAVTGSFFPHMKHFSAFSDNIIALCTPFIRIATAIKLQGFGVLKFIWPQTLSHDYSYAQILPVESVLDPGLIATILGLPIVAGLIFCLLKKYRMKLLMLFAFYILSVAPTSNILTATGTIFAERLFYLPSAWLCVISAIVLRSIITRIGASASLGILSAILILSGARTWTRGEDWASQMSIALKGVETSPLSNKTWNNLAVELAKDNQFQEAVYACDKAIAIYPELKTAIKNKAFYNIKLRKYEDAEKDLLILARSNSRDTEVYNKLGALLANKGLTGEGIKMWERSLELDANQPIIKNALKELSRQADKK